MTFLILFWTFFKIGAFTFGGGYAMLPLIEEEVTAHGWMTMEEIVNFVAVSESTPGPFAINAATYVGATVAGIPGAFFATTGVILPSFLIILLVARVYQTFQRSKVIQGIMSGLKPAVVGLIGAAFVSVLTAVFFPSGIAITEVPGRWQTWVSAAVFALSLFLMHRKIHPILIICIAAAIGVVAGQSVSKAANETSAAPSYTYHLVKEPHYDSAAAADGQSNLATASWFYLRLYTDALLTDAQSENTAGKNVDGNGDTAMAASGNTSAAETGNSNPSNSLSGTNAEADRFAGLEKALQVINEETDQISGSFVDENKEASRKQNEEMGGDYSFTYTDEDDLFVVRADSRCLSVLRLDNGYWGGAHGMLTSYGYSFDADTGERLKILSTRTNLMSTVGIERAYQVSSADGSPEPLQKYFAVSSSADVTLTLRQQTALFMLIPGPFGSF